MIRLIASDVDGTLIKDSTPDLYPEMADTIRKLKERGILFCAASGRQYASLKNVFREVAEDIAYIAENGAHIRYLHKDISVTPMKREGYRVPVPSTSTRKKYKLLLNSDEERFGGWGNEIAKEILVEAVPCQNKEFSISLDLPPYGAAVFVF